MKSGKSITSCDIITALDTDLLLKYSSAINVYITKAIIYLLIL